MRTYSLILFFFGIFFSSYGQELRCSVIAPSGMNVRAEPSLSAKVVDRVYKDSVVYVFAETFGELTYESVPGYWRRLSRSNVQGYIWDGYLDIIETIGVQNNNVKNDSIYQKAEKKSDMTESRRNDSPSKERLVLLLETYNHCGDVSHINPNAFWYALIPDKEQVNVEAVELSVNLSRSRLSSSMEFDIQTDNEKRSLFIIGSETALDIPSVFKNLELELRAGGRQVLPGQRRMLSDDVYLSAIGNVREISDECPIIDEYRLTIHAFGNKQNVLSLFEDMGDCGVPELYWFGDLNGDGVPSMIFVTVSEQSNIFHLLDYSTNKNTGAYRVVSTFEMKECVD